ncbi:MAG TPA: ankyrin repeat domain-containing protein [Methylocella sp.]|nr:ankyrin repeat domain-containing protein [Methylocella sp.]
MRERMPFQRIDLSEAVTLIDSTKLLLLDVRDAQSYEAGHIEGAQNVSIRNLDSILTGTAKNTPVLIYCYHGNASQEFGQIFSDFGFSQVFSLDGGYEAWAKCYPAPSRVPSSAVLRDWLITQGFSDTNVNGVIGNSMTPLMKASHAGETEIVRALIAEGADLQARNGDGNNALWLACAGDQLAIMDLLITAGIDIDNRNDNGATCLMYAASASKPAVVEKLISSGGNLSLETQDGFTALDMAASLECLNLLRQATRGKQSQSDAANV